MNPDRADYCIARTGAYWRYSFGPFRTSDRALLQNPSEAYRGLGELRFCRVDCRLRPLRDKRADYLVIDDRPEDSAGLRCLPHVRVLKRHSLHNEAINLSAGDDGEHDEQCQRQDEHGLDIIVRPSAPMRQSLLDDNNAAR